MQKTEGAIVHALLAAVFYAVSVPASKVLLQYVGPTMLAALLYLGAGIGVGSLFLFRRSDQGDPQRLSREDLPFVVGMILLDIAAPIFLMLGIANGTSANASLLGNFEIVATSLVALLVFREAISRRLWCAIALITIASLLLSVDGVESFQLSYGSLFVLLATVCWGFENNCTRKISSKNTYEIVVLKGVFSGLGALAIALAKGEGVPGFAYVLVALLLGFVAYGLSIFFYVRAQRGLGAAKTSAYYAIAPFVSAFLSFAVLHERLSEVYPLALVVMTGGSVLVVVDTLRRQHEHVHMHTFVHTHDGTTHVHTVEHCHEHNHYVSEERHGHSHTTEELEKLHASG